MKRECKLDATNEGARESRAISQRAEFSIDCGRPIERVLPRFARNRVPTSHAEINSQSMQHSWGRLRKVARNY